jgi:hypothetical protein
MTPSEECLVFYFEIGLTLTQWAQLERSLLEVAGSCMNKRDYNALGHGFFSIENFRSKLAFVGQLVENKVKPDSARAAEWARLSARITAASIKRNKLAHYRVTASIEPVGKRYALSPWIDRSKLKVRSKKYHPPPGALFATDVAELRWDIFALTMSLENFAAKLARRRIPFPASAAQALNPRPSLAQLLAQIPAYNHGRSQPPHPK